FFSSRRRHTRFDCDWIQTCALPILRFMKLCFHGGDFLLVQQDRIATVEAKLHESYYTFPMTIRPYQDRSKAYFNAKIFKSFFPGRWPEFTGAEPTPAPSPNPSPTK